MELDKRVDEIETDLKIMKGEIKELLIDIRDLVNKNENPFCSIPCSEILKSPVPAKDETECNQPNVVGNEDAECRLCEGASETENQTVKKNEDSLQSVISDRESPVQNIRKQEEHRSEPESFRKIDTFMLVELMRWVDYAVRTVGHENLEGLLNLYALTGHLSEETKKIIENIANLSIEEPAEEDRVSMKDNITVLSQLSAILSPEGFRKNIQTFYETPGWRDKENEKKTGLVSVEFKPQKAERSKRAASGKSDARRHI